MACTIAVLVVFSAIIFATITGLEGNAFCGLKQCESENYTFTACTIPDDRTIVNVTISAEVSESNCTFYDDSFDNYNGTTGVYGYCEGTIWVDKGCRALFYVCMSDSSTSETRNCSIDMITTSTISSLSTTYTSSIPNITDTTIQAPNQTASEATNGTSPSPTASNQTMAETSNFTSTSPASENQTSPTPTGSTVISKNDTFVEDNSTTSTMTSFSVTSSTDTQSTSPTAPTTTSTTRENIDPNDDDDDDVWKIPIYAGVIIIAVVLAIFLGCGILLIYLLCQKEKRRYAKSLVDIRDESDWKSENLKQFLKQELHTAVKNRNTIGAIGEVENDKTTYLTPVSDTSPRTKDNEPTSLEGSVRYLNVRTSDTIGFLNPRYRNNGSVGKEGRTDAMVQSNRVKLQNQSADSTGTNTRGFQQSGEKLQTDDYESVSPVDMKETMRIHDEQTDISKL